MEIYEKLQNSVSQPPRPYKLFYKNIDGLEKCIMDDISTNIEIQLYVIIFAKNWNYSWYGEFLPEEGDFGDWDYTYTELENHKIYNELLIVGIREKN
jgi:hypothetical protein